MKKITRVFAILLCLLTVLGCGAQVFASSYKTYTYSIDGFYMLSPDAYRPESVRNYQKMGIDLELKNPSDLVVDEDGDIYIADAGNNRIIVLDGTTYQQKFVISTFSNDQGTQDALKNPKGVFVKEDKIYVADTNNARIVVFQKDVYEGKPCALFYKIIREPQSNLFDQSSVFTPVALAVDDSGRVYVISSSTYQGVIAMTEESAFVGFIGAQQVTYSVFDMFWRRFQTEEQLANQRAYLPTEYNNITIDEKGFIYVTTSSIDESNQQAAIESKDGKYAPVKKFNSSGDDIMKRNGFFAPSGEVQVSSFNTGTDLDAPTGPSKIVDVALGPEGTWSIIDSTRMKVFTYDSDGKLLFVFGDIGRQLGNLSSATAIAYKNDELIVLDAAQLSLTTYRRTDYGDVLIQALKDTNDRKYENSVANWKKILQRNNNFDAAYIGIGKALYREGDWEGAMEYYKSAYDTDNYSAAFKEMRKEWVAKYIWVIPLVIIAFVLAIKFFLGYAKKVNARVAVSGEKKTLWKEILYGFHLMFHPFDGFWDLKHEKRGSVRGALAIIALTILAFTYNSVGKAYLFNPRGATTSILVTIISILIPLFLWVTANWCLTTLFEGEGSYRDIFVATGYALLPIPLVMFPVTLLTHVLSASEAGIVSLLIAFAWIWAGMLLFFGMQVTHDYTLLGGFLAAIGTLVGMVFIMFVAVLFSTLLTKMVGFVSNIITEITYRTS